MRGRKEREQTSALGQGRVGNGPTLSQKTTERTRNSPASGTSLTYLKRRETHSILALFSQGTIGSDGKDGLERGTQGMNHRTEGLYALLWANTN